MNIQNSTNYLFTLPLPYADSLTLLEKCMNSIGKAKKVNKENGIITGRFRISKIYSVKVECNIQQADSPAVVFCFPDNAFLKVQDKRWFQVATQLQKLVGDTPLGIDVTDHATRITRILRFRDGFHWCIYNNGRILIKPPKTIAPPPQEDDEDGLDWIDRIEEMDALFGE